METNMIVCPKCGRGVTPDGETRTARCGGCGGTYSVGGRVSLPDPTPATAPESAPVQRPAPAAPWHRAGIGLPASGGYTEAVKARSAPLSAPTPAAVGAAVGAAAVGAAAVASAAKKDSEPPAAPAEERAAEQIPSEEEAAAGAPEAAEEGKAESAAAAPKGEAYRPSAAELEANAAIARADKRLSERLLSSADRRQAQKKLRRADRALARGDFGKAEALYGEVLLLDAENAYAYLGMGLAEEKATSLKALADKGGAPENKNLLIASHYGDGALRRRLAAAARTSLRAKETAERAELTESESRRRALARLTEQRLAEIGAREAEKKERARERGASSEALAKKRGKELSAQLERAEKCLSKGKFKKAERGYRAALEIDGECADAYLGLLLSELCLTGVHQLPEAKRDFETSESFLLAMHYGSYATRRRLEAALAEVQAREGLAPVPAVQRSAPVAKKESAKLSKKEKKQAQRAAEEEKRRREAEADAEADRLAEKLARRLHRGGSTAIIPLSVGRGMSKADERRMIAENERIADEAAERVAEKVASRLNRESATVVTPVPVLLEEKPQSKKQKKAAEARANAELEALSSRIAEKVAAQNGETVLLPMPKLEIEKPLSKRELRLAEKEAEKRANAEADRLAERLAKRLSDAKASAVVVPVPVSVPKKLSRRQEKLAARAAEQEANRTAQRIAERVAALMPASAAPIVVAPVPTAEKVSAKEKPLSKREMRLAAEKAEREADALAERIAKKFAAMMPAAPAPVMIPAPVSAPEKKLSKREQRLAAREAEKEANRAAERIAERVAKMMPTQSAPVVIPVPTPAPERKLTKKQQRLAAREAETEANRAAERIAERVAALMPAAPAPVIIPAPVAAPEKRLSRHEQRLAARKAKREQDLAAERIADKLAQRVGGPSVVTLPVPVEGKLSKKKQRKAEKAAKREQDAVADRIADRVVRQIGDKAAAPVVVLPTETRDELATLRTVLSARLDQIEALAKKQGIETENTVYQSKVAADVASLEARFAADVAAVEKRYAELEKQSLLARVNAAEESAIDARNAAYDRSEMTARLAAAQLEIARLRTADKRAAQGNMKIELPTEDRDRIPALLKSADRARRRGKFTRAEKGYRRILAADPTVSDAYLGALLCELGLRREKSLRSHDVSFSDRESFVLAVRFADAPRAEHLMSYAKSTDKRVQSKRDRYAEERMRHEYKTKNDRLRDREALAVADAKRRLEANRFAGIRIGRREEQQRLDCAEALLARKKYGKAVVQLDELISLAPDLGDAYMLRLLAANEMSRIKRLATLEGDLRMNPDYILACRYCDKGTVRRLTRAAKRAVAADASNEAWVEKTTTELDRRDLADEKNRRELFNRHSGDHAEVKAAELEVAYARDAVAKMSPAGPKKLRKLLAKGKKALKRGSWTKANEHYDAVLALDPMNTAAYVGKLCAWVPVHGTRELSSAKVSITYNRYYLILQRIADPETRRRFAKIARKIDARLGNRYEIASDTDAARLSEKRIALTERRLRDAERRNRKLELEAHRLRKGKSYEQAYGSILYGEGSGEELGRSGWLRRLGVFGFLLGLLLVSAAGIAVGVFYARFGGDISALRAALGL